ncbi:signal peptidase I [Enemella evansiae]|uniref:signal peptidase I n=1 Tax=Enemella evansiae TaxID=2016499 RepID=UPI001E54556B|nr:signal peptidase I [Enemella evansiae]
MSQWSDGSGWAGDDPDRTALRPSSPRRAAADAPYAPAMRGGGFDTDDTQPPPWPEQASPRRALTGGSADLADATRESPRPFEPAEIDRTTRRDQTQPRGTDGFAPGGPAGPQAPDPWQRPIPNPPTGAPASPPVHGAPAAPVGGPPPAPAPAGAYAPRRLDPAPAPRPIGQPAPRHSADEPDDSTLPSRTDTVADRTAGAKSDKKADKKAGKRAKTEEKDQRPTSAKVLGMVREIGVIVVGALIITTLLRSFVFQPFEVPSGSMENTLQINDKIIAQRVLDFRRGDIVVFSDSNKWLDDGSGKPAPGPVRKALEFVGLLPDSADEHLVKRVIGMPGDRVKCCDKLGRVSVNGYPLDEESYLYADSGGRNKPAEKPFEVVVPADRIFVMGDHRANSGDSRCHLQDVTAAGGKAGSSAFIPISDVVGSVALIASPFSRFQRLETPQIYAGIPPPQQVPPPEPVIVQVSEGC